MPFGSSGVPQFLMAKCPSVEQQRMAALVCADRALSVDDLLMLLGALGLLGEGL